jgi:excisionase family DNA binding protein
LPAQPLLKAEDVAERLAISRDRVYRLVERGDLPAVRIGLQLRFEPEAIDTWIAEHRETAA